MEDEASGSCSPWSARLSSKRWRSCSSWPVYLSRRNGSVWSSGLSELAPAVRQRWSYLLSQSEPQPAGRRPPERSSSGFRCKPFWKILRLSLQAWNEKVNGVLALVPVLCREAGDLSSERRPQAFLCWHEKQKWVTLHHFPSLNEWDGFLVENDDVRQIDYILCWHLLGNNVWNRPHLILNSFAHWLPQNFEGNFQGSPKS